MHIYTFQHTSLKKIIETYIPKWTWWVYNPLHTPHIKNSIDTKSIFQWIRLVNQDLVSLLHTSRVCCISVILVFEFLQPLCVHSMNGWLPVWMLCTACMPGARRRCWIPGTRLGMIMNHHVGAGNKTLFSARAAASALTSWAISPVLVLKCFIWLASY